MASRPELLVRGDADDLKSNPGGWMTAAGRVLAHGRDPYFPPWPDVMQLDAFYPALRAETADVQADIAGQCDGIRCNMAMLMTNQVFARTWGGRTGPAPAAEFWPTMLGELRARPETVMIAEAYWDMEWVLQEQGFNFCYDKRSMTGSSARTPPPSAITCADLNYQSRLVRLPQMVVVWRAGVARGPIGQQRVPRAAPPPVRCQVRLACRSLRRRRR
jgi:hypothetical protein